MSVLRSSIFTILIIINKLLKTHNAEKSKARQVVPEIDVDAFLKKEQDFKKRLAETKK